VLPSSQPLQQPCSWNSLSNRSANLAQRLSTVCGLHQRNILHKLDVTTMSLLHSLRDDPSLRHPAVAFILLLTVVLLGERVLAGAFANISGSGLPGWLPQFGTTGQTVTYYLLAFDVLQFIALPVTLLWLAYAYGRHRATGPAN